MENANTANNVPTANNSSPPKGPDPVREFLFFDQPSGSHLRITTFPKDIQNSRHIRIPRGERS